MECIGSSTTRWHHSMMYYSHLIENFFTDNYDHPIFEDGVQLKDMVYLQRNITSNTIMDKYSLEESLSIWEYNAEHWDNYMGDESNDFHRDVVRPKVNELLDIQTNDFILDISCGNGNYSAFMAEQGARVMAFDYSKKMI